VTDVAWAPNKRLKPTPWRARLAGDYAVGMARAGGTAIARARARLNRGVR
jgi:hypothetical protein